MTLWRPGMRVTAERLSGLIMDWTPLEDLGDFEPDFGPHSSIIPRMRKSAWAGTEIWDLEGDITAPDINTSETTHMFTFSAEHRVSRTHIFRGGANGSSYYGFWLQINSSGVVNAGLPGPASTGGSTRLSLDSLRITNPRD